MSFSLNLLTFVKRENSTKVPSAAQLAAGYSTNVVLLEGTSVVDPVFKLQVSNPIGYNYAYCSTFNRYYFINDWVSDKDFWYAHCTCDVLASWKTTIGSSSEYVLRAASSYDEDVIDGLYPMNADVSSDTVDKVSPFIFDGTSFRTSSYIVGIINNSTDAKFGAVTYYQLTTTQMGQLLGFLLGSTSYLNIDPTELSDNMVKALVNPAQYIVECYSLPYQVTSGTSVNIKVGWWDTNVQGIPFTPRISITDNLAYTTHDLGTYTITTPKHPDWNPSGGPVKRYLRCYPWTSYTFYAGPFGVIQLDPSSMAKSATISYEVSANDFGDAQLLIKNYDGDVIHKATCNVKQTYQLAQLNNNPMGFWTGVIGTATGAAASAVAQNPAGMITSITSGIASNMENLYPKLNTSGSQYTQSEAYSDWYLVAEFHYPVDDDPVHRGRPLCQVKTINTLSGYILVSDPDIAIAGTADENTKIKGYMAGGFYYE